MGVAKIGGRGLVAGAAARGGRSGPVALGGAGADEARVAGAGGGVELGDHGGQAHGGGVAGVDAAEQRVDEVVDHLVAEAAAQVGADGDVVAATGGVGRVGGQGRGPARARSTPAAETSPVAASASRSVGTPMTWPPGSGLAGAVEEEVGGALGRRDQLAVELQVVAQGERPRHPEQEGVGRLVDRPAGDHRGLELAAEPVGLDHRDVAPRPATAGTPPPAR